MKFFENEKQAEVEKLLKEVSLDRLNLAGTSSMKLIAPTRKSSDYLKSAVGWVYACINAISDEVAMMNIKLYKQSGKEAIEIDYHPALDLLYRVNSFTTKFDFFHILSQYLLLTGEAPFFVSFKGGRPDAMLQLRPDRLSIKKGDGNEMVAGYEYEVERGKKIPLDSKEVIFLRCPDPNNPMRGLGPLQAVARTVDIDEYSEEYNRNFFFNSARPDSALETDMRLDSESLAKLERKFDAKFKSYENAHKTIILQAGLKFKPISLTQRDMDFMEQQKFSRDKILGIFRVPRTVLGITDDVNRANAEATDYVFAKRTVKPMIERIIQQLNEFLLPLFPGSERLYFDYDSPVPEDLTQKREWQKAGLEKGWITINEARKSDGLTPIGDEADKLRLPNGLNEIESYDSTTANSDSQPAPKERTRQIAKRIRKAEIIETATAKIAEVLKEKLTKPGNKEVKEVKKEVAISEEETKLLDFQNKQLNVATDYENKFKSRFNDIFDQQLSEVLSKMDKKEVNPKDFLLSSTKERKRYIKELSELMSAMLVAQAKEAFQFIGVDSDVGYESALVTSYLSKRAFKFSTPVTQETNKLLSEAFKEGLKIGEGIPKLKKRVSDLFVDMKKTRSETIARSETIRATNYASQQAYIDSGVVEGKRWLAALDERLCPFCNEMNGRVTDLKNSFADKGSIFTGTDGSKLDVNYETVYHPPLHPNCRCTLIPIVGKSQPAPKKKEQVDKEKKILESLDKILDEVSNDE